MRIPKPKRREKRPNSQMRCRIAVLIIFLSVVGFAAVGVRLFWMQVVRYDFYEEKALSFQTRDTIIEPKRGTIYDRNMKVLAESAATETVLINPKGLSNWVTEKNKRAEEGQPKLSLEDVQEQVAQILSDNLELVYDTVLKKVQRTEMQSMEIKGGVEKDVVNKIYADMKTAEIPTGSGRSIYTTPDTKRYYPYSSFASQAIGFLNINGAVGGIELQYNEVLSGTSGRVVRAANAQNSDMPFEYEQYIPAEDGSSIVTTLDETIQHYLEKHLETGLADNPQARGGLSGIVMDIKTGEILGMANMPDFDVNAYDTIEKDSLYYNELMGEIEQYFTKNGISGTVGEGYLTNGLWAELPQGMSDDQKKDLDALRTDKLQAMWRNHIVSDTYEPGSTFKLMTVATGLETHAVSESDSFTCGGSMMVKGWNKPIKCHKIAGHGTQTLTEALMNSCNVAMMQIAAKVTGDSFFDYFEAFGLTEKTGIDLPGETKPSTVLYHTKQELIETPSDLATASFSQRFPDSTAPDDRHGVRHRGQRKPQNPAYGAADPQFGRFGAPDHWRRRSSGRWFPPRLPPLCARRWSLLFRTAPAKMLMLQATAWAARPQPRKLPKNMTARGTAWTTRIAIPHPLSAWRPWMTPRSPYSSPFRICLRVRPMAAARLRRRSSAVS